MSGLGHRFGEGPWLFRGLSEEVNEGEVVALIGPSGSGKSTLLSMISGWLAPVEGVIDVGAAASPGVTRSADGARLPDSAGFRKDTGEAEHAPAHREKPRIAWVFQNPHGVPGRSVLDHVALPFLARGLDPDEADDEARRLLADFRLDHVAERPFKTLSGGEAQRMLLARALASDPDVLLVDEPTAQLDQRTAAHVADTLTALRDRELVVIIATHDPHVRDRCTRIIDLAAYVDADSDEPQEDDRTPHEGSDAPIGPKRSPRRPGTPMPERSMRTRALVREACRDVMSGTAWIGIWTLVVSLLVGGGIALDLRIIAREANAAEEYQKAMASVRVIEAHGAIDGAGCRAFARLDGVEGALAIRKARDPLTSAAMPSSSFHTWEYAGDIAGVFDMDSLDAGAYGIVVAQQVGEALGLKAGNELALANGASAHLQGIYSWDETDGRRSGYAYSALVPVPAGGAFDACWVRLWPLNPEMDSLMRTSVIPTGEEQQVDMYSVNANLGSSFDGEGRYHGRITAPIMWFIAAGAFIVGALSVSRRRLEIASDLHVGVARVDLLIKLLIHAAMGGLSACIVVFPVLTRVILLAPTGDQSALWAHAGLLGTVGAAGFLLGTLGAGLMVREKKLFDYFKTR
ncbi:ATP-binding cassette domain-containing protein [Actinomyces sp. B33]|uniref:ATP-binding cassette domain-containing protein n=1 Tax=Actinomyces sp. B33 TaxID=2942131 RepID=UPI002340F287|nr:ATP-binding cassette domain-containing protein [Actinomyces sp. B33]MDC4232746.1 ATP-binding cassette domain-containing protein [Actinomyces sp. B33]